MDSTGLQLPAGSIPQFTGQHYEILIVVFLALGLGLMLIFALAAYIVWSRQKSSFLEAAKNASVDLGDDEGRTYTDSFATDGYGWCLIAIIIVTLPALVIFLPHLLHLRVENFIFFVVLILFGGFFWGIFVWIIPLTLRLPGNFRKALDNAIAAKAAKVSEDYQVQKYFTPLVLRSGFPYGWCIAIGVLIAMSLVHTVLIFISGAFGIWLIYAPILIIIDVLVFLLATWAVRATFHGFDELFGIFSDEVTLRYYHWFKRPPESDPKVSKKGSSESNELTDSQQAIRDLFVSKTEYSNFRKKVLRTVFSKREFRWMVGVLPVFFIHLYFWLGDPFYWTYHWHVGYPYVQYSLLVAVVTTLFYYMFGITVIRQIFAYFWVLRDLRKEKRNLRVWNYAKEPFSEQDGVEKGAYKTFYLNTVPIGRKAYQISLAVILIAGIIIVRNAFYIEWLNRQTVTSTQWIVALVTIPAALLLFLLPQFEIHKLLTDAKLAVLKVWNEEYCQLSRKFITTLHKIRKGEYDKDLRRKIEEAEEEKKLREQRFREAEMQGIKGKKQKLEEAEKEKQKLTKAELREIKEKHERDIRENLEGQQFNLEALRILIEDTNLESTWSFERQMILNVSGASTIPTVAAIIQTLLMPFF